MIGSRGVITIAEALRQNNSLCTLNLDYITFGDDGATSIASLLTINSSLKELRMECCAIDDDGVYAALVAKNDMRASRY